jgi:hypothetical protein
MPDVVIASSGTSEAIQNVAMPLDRHDRFTVSR